MSKKNKKRTAYAVICPRHGQVFLSLHEYDQQMDRPSDFWRCPLCGLHSEFDDNNYDDWTETHMRRDFDDI